MNTEIADIAINFHRNDRYLYEVGGHLRDEFLGRLSHDWDATTSARPDETIEILRKSGYDQIYEVGREYGTIGTRLHNGMMLEITTYRGEVYPSNSRKPLVVFGDSLAEDLARRDFTINAMARNPVTGDLIDPHGGLTDIEDRVVRCVGNDNLRFAEDPLRMMRGIRFAVQLGFYLQCTFTYPSRLEIISKERVQEELNKILLSPNPALGIDYLCETGLMQYIVPEFLGLRGINQGHYHIKDAFEHSLMVLHKARTRDHGEDNLVFRIAAWLHDIGKPEAMSTLGGDVTFHAHQSIGADKAKVILERLRYSNDIIEAMYRLIDMHMSVLLLKDTDLSKKVIRRFINRIGERYLWMLIDISICDMRSMSFEREELIRQIIDIVSEVTMEDKGVKLQSPIDGEEIMEVLNLPPGPMIGRLKTYLTELVIDGTIMPNDKKKAMELAGLYVATAAGVK